MSGKFVFVTGLSGAGKTTLGECLKKDDCFLHFDVDVWAFGGDAVTESGKVPDAKMKVKRDPELQQLFDNMYENGLPKNSSGDPSMQVFEDFFTRLKLDVLTVRSQNPGLHMIVSFSVYLREVRDMVRRLFGEDLHFIVLNPSIEKVAGRRVQHWQDTAKERGLTMFQFLTIWGVPEGTPVQPDEEVIANLLAYATNGAEGFEAAQNDEPNTLSIDDCTIEEAYAQARQYIDPLPCRPYIPLFFEFMGDNSRVFDGRSVQSHHRLDVLFAFLAPRFERSMNKKVIRGTDSANVRVQKMKHIDFFLRMFRVKRCASILQAEAYRFVALSEIARRSIAEKTWAGLVKGIFGVDVASIRNLLAHADFDCNTLTIISTSNLDNGWTTKDVENAYSDTFRFLVPDENDPEPLKSIASFTLDFQACCCMFTALFNKYCVQNGVQRLKLFGVYDVTEDASRVITVSIDNQPQLTCVI